MKKNNVMIPYTEFARIMRADVVRVYDLKPFFKKDEIDYDEYGNIFIGFNDKSKGLPILVAHTDNVLGDEKEPVFDLSKRYIKGMSNGIGFDDKAGIMAIISLWRFFKEQKFRIILPANEETGGDGAKMIDPVWYSDAQWILELDRRGGKDVIQTSGITRLCSDEFVEKWEEMGYKRAIGTFTDVNIFKPKADSINMMNISIGYYKPHTDEEYLDTKEFEKIVNDVATFIQQEYTFKDDVPDVIMPTKTNYWKRDYNYYDLDEYCAYCGRHIISDPVYGGDGYAYCCEDCKNKANKY